MKNRSIKIVLLAVILIAISACLLYQKKEGFKPISIGQAVVNAEIADTEAERTLGLGNRSSLPENNGMLFVFDHPDRYGFWMKDTNFPLDFIWIDENKKIIDISADVLPASFPQVYYPVSSVSYVLEVNGGYTEKHGIKIGEATDF